jgi:hypothetical protein
VGGDGVCRVLGRWWQLAARGVPVYVVTYASIGHGK